MNRSQYRAMLLDLKENPKKLPEYRKRFKNVYPFSDGIFKMLMANEAKPERTIKFLNAMLGLTGKKAIKSFTLGVQEQPGILTQKTAIFDIYGTTEAKENILIEVQQNANVLFVDRLVYYTSRIVSNQVKKSQSYELPHIYVLSILCEDQFTLEPGTYFHHCQIMRNGKHPFSKIDIYLVETEKFFAIDKRIDVAHREQSVRAKVLRMFRDILDDKTIDEQIAKKLLDKDFAKDVSFKSYTDELLLLEVDNMTDMLYEKQGSYLQGKKEVAANMLKAKIPLKQVAALSGLSLEELKTIKVQ